LEDLVEQVCDPCKATGFIEDEILKNCPQCTAVGEITKLIEENCPQCAALGQIDDMLSKDCPVCNAVGQVDQPSNTNCPVCKAAGSIKDNCPKCKAVGTISRELKGCKLCKGKGKIDCGGCGGSGKIKKKVGVPPVQTTIKSNCPLCFGSGGVSCPHNLGEIVLDVIKEACPTCNGAKLVSATCPNCKGAKVISQVIKATCPKCNGEKLLKELQKIPCPTCAGAKLIKQNRQVVCPTCMGAKMIHEATKIVCPKCKGKRILADVRGKGCPFCSPLLIVPTLKAVCKRLEDYQERRRNQSHLVVETYIDAHHKLAHCIMESRWSEIFDCYEDFFDELADLMGMELSLTDLISSELANLQEEFEEVVLAALDDALEQLVPDFYKEIKSAIFEGAIKEFAKITQVKLTQPEIDAANSIWDAYESIDDFPPLANGITLFLHSLHMATPDREGLARAAWILGNVDNIDSRCQPFLTRPWNDAEFEYFRYYRPYVDPQATGEHCQLDPNRGSVDGPPIWSADPLDAPTPFDGPSDEFPSRDAPGDDEPMDGPLDDDQPDDPIKSPLRRRPLGRQSNKGGGRIDHGSPTPVQFRQPAPLIPRKLRETNSNSRPLPSRGKTLTKTEPSPLSLSEPAYAVTRFVRRKGHITALSHAGVRNSRQLLAVARKKRSLTKFSEETRIPEAELRDYVAIADLMRIEGVGPQYAIMLHEIGVTSVADLTSRNRTAERIAARCEKWADEQPGLNSIPTPEQVAGWMRQVKDLPS
jgi:DnaJ-class molecular chaperone